MSSTLKPSRHGFTLIELLVVISIIAILMGLLFPVFGVLRAKAWATRTRETTILAANAWHFFFQENRAFPKELIGELPGTQVVDGDATFQMTKEALCLLNWYGDKPDVYLGTEEEWYRILLSALGTALADGLRPRDDIEVTIPAQDTETGDMETVTVSLREKFFERNEAQWENGLKGDRDNRVIWVKLDTDYDGKILYQGETVRKSAIAWGVDEDGKNPIVTSW